MSLKKKKKQLVAAALAALMATSTTVPTLVSAAPVAFAADTAPTSGTCGENLTWVLKNGVLTISGTGPMMDWSDTNKSSWFYQQDITKVVIQEGVTSIGDDAFIGCHLRNITIPNSVTSIGESAFDNCTSLTSVTIPDSVTSIGQGAFMSCHNLKNIIISNNVTKIEPYTFSGCSGGLTNVTIPDSVTSIGESAFSGCYGLEHITIPNSVSSIGEYAFQSCRFLTNIIIPDSVTRIEPHTFLACRDLTKITIPANVTSIGERAFDSCDNLTDVYYAGSKEQWNKISIGNSNEAIVNATIHYNTDEDTASTSGTCGENLTWTLKNGVLTISGTGPMATGSYPGDSPWYTRQDITEVVIEDGVTNIGAWAFAGCENLTNVTIPNSVTYIGYHSLLGCTNLAVITIPNSVTEISQGAFSQCSSLENITIPDSVTSFGYYAFARSGLTNIIIPKSMTRIGPAAFSACDALRSVVIPDNVIEIQEEAFANCDNLTDVYYAGSKEQWDKIAIGNSNEPIVNATIHYNTNIDQNAKDFNVYLYRANWLQDTTHPAVSNVNESISNWETPSQIFLKALQDSGFDEGVAAWRLFDFVFSTIDDLFYPLDFAGKQKDMYSAIILDALGESVSFDAFDSMIEDPIKGGKKFISTVQEIMEKTFEIKIDLYDSDYFQNMTYEEKGLVSELTKEFFKKEHPYLDQFGSFLTNLTTVMDFVGNIENFFENVVAYMYVAELTDDMKDVLRQLYQDSLKTDNQYLQSALSDCINIIDSSSEDVMKKIVGGEIVATGSDLGKYLFKELIWKNVTDYISIQFPVVAALQTGYKTGKFASNVLVSTDDTIANYLNMIAMDDIEQLASQSYTTLKNKYLKEDTVSSAKAYLSALDLIFTLRDEDCKTAYEFIDVLDNTWVNIVAKFFGKDDYAATKNAINTFQHSYFNIHESALKSWLFSLLDDKDYQHSGLYEYYSYLFEQSTKRILNKEFVATKKLAPNNNVYEGGGEGGGTGGRSVLSARTAVPLMDLYVYDSSNQVVAYVEGNRVFCSSDVDDLMIAKDGDSTIVRFFDNSNYRVEYVGQDTGNMDIKVSEFDAQEKAVRTVNFFDVALKKDSRYSLNADNKTLQQNAYVLKNTLGDVKHSYDSLQKTGTAHKISVQSGTVIKNDDMFLSTEAFENEELNIFAMIPENYKFVSWTSNVGNHIFTDAARSNTTVRMPNSDVVIKAVLSNTNLATTPVATPTISPKGGGFTSTQTVTITCDTDNAKIYYTTDGSIPTNSSMEYTKPFPLSSSTTVKAIAVKEGMRDSSVATATFTKNTSSNSRRPNRNGSASTIVARPTKYTATFSANGGNGVIPTVTVSNDNKVVLPQASSLTKQGYTFQGWKSSANNTIYPVGHTVSLHQDTTFTASWIASTNQATTSTNPVKLDTSAVNVINGNSYAFLVNGNNDTANIKVEVVNPHVASVALDNASDPRGAMYRVTAKAAGSTDIKVTYQGQTTSMKVNVTESKGSITLDTANYILAPGNQYTIGAFLKDAGGNPLSAEQIKAMINEGKLKVRDSRTGSIVDLEQLSNGNFRVTGKNEGTAYIIYEVGGTHASVRVDVQKGVQQHGAAVRNTSYFVQ